MITLLNINSGNAQNEQKKVTFAGSKTAQTVCTEKVRSYVLTKNLFVHLSSDVWSWNLF